MKLKQLMAADRCVIRSFASVALVWLIVCFQPSQEAVLFFLMPKQNSPFSFSPPQKKCERYYPQFKEEPVTVGPFRISCVSK